MQCSQCGFCFSYPYVAGDERFYSLAYVRSGYPKRQSNGNRLANARTRPCNQGDFTDQSFAMHAE